MALHRVQKRMLRLAQQDGEIDLHFDFAVLRRDLDMILYIAEHYMVRLDAANRKIARRALKVTSRERVYKVRPRRK